MDKLRLRFEKKQRAIYLSHLDLMRTMQRAFLRAGCPLAYSEGFNPHAIMSVALPLSVGICSQCELLDFRLQERTEIFMLPERLNAVMPEGIHVLEVYEPKAKISQIKWLRISGRFEYDNRDPANMATLCEDLFYQQALVVTRKTKRGEGEADIRPMIRDVSFAPEGNCVRMDAVISAQEPTLNPALIIAAIHTYLPQAEPDFTAFERVELYYENMEIFR